MSEYASESQLYILYRDVYAMLKTRDKIINDYLDKENLEKAENRLATAKTLNNRLGSQVPLRNLDYGTFMELSRYL